MPGPSGPSPAPAAPAAPARPLERRARRLVVGLLRRAGFDGGWFAPTTAPVVVPPAPPERGSWWSAASYGQEYREAMRAADLERLQDRCPDCGDPLVAGPDGVLFCNTDGWGRPRRQVRWEAPADPLVACPDDGEPLLTDPAGRLRCPFCGHAW